MVPECGAHEVFSLPLQLWEAMMKPKVMRKRHRRGVTLPQRSSGVDDAVSDIHRRGLWEAEPPSRHTSVKIFKQPMIKSAWRPGTS